MTPVVLIGIMIGAPILLLTVLRINAAIVFLSLCLGAVLVQFAGADASSMVALAATHATLSDYTVRLGLLLVPVVFTMIVMIRTVKGAFKLLLNLLPATAAGVVGILLAVPLLSPGLRGAIIQTTIWHHIEALQVAVVIASTVVSLLFLWLQRPKRTSDEDKKKRR